MASFGYGNTVPFGSGIGGFFQGFANARTAKRQDAREQMLAEQRNAYMKAQSEYMKTQQKLADANIAMINLRKAYLDDYRERRGLAQGGGAGAKTPSAQGQSTESLDLGQVLGVPELSGQQSPQYGKSFAGGGVVDQLAAASMQPAPQATAPGIASPRDAAMLDWAMGGDLDLSGAAQDEWERYNDETINRRKQAEFEFEKRKEAFDQSEVDWRPVTVDGVEYEDPYLKTGERAPGVERRLKGKTEATVKREKAQKKMTASISNMLDNLLALNKAGAMVNVKGSTIDNIFASLRSSALGQSLGKIIGTDEQSIRNTIERIRPNLVQLIRQATEMGVRGMDTPQELKFYLQTVGDTQTDIQSNIAALAILDETYGTGEVLDRIKKMGDKSLIQRVKTLKEEGKQRAKAFYDFIYDPETGEYVTP